MKKSVFKYFTYFSGEVTLYRSKKEFQSIKYRLISTMRDLYRIELLPDVNLINKVWSCYNGEFEQEPLAIIAQIKKGQSQ